MEHEILLLQLVLLLLYIHVFSWYVFYKFRELKVLKHICLTTGAAAALHRGPSSAQHPAGQSRAGHSLGPASDRRPSAGDSAAGVEAVPGPAGGHPSSAQQCSGQTPADGAEVSAPRQLAKGHGDQSTTAKPPAV